MNYRSLLSIILLSSLLVGCEDKMTQSYLMTHPFELKKEVDRCQSLRSGNAETLQQCKLVMNAADQLQQIINLQQQNPQQFGEQLLAAQMALAKADADLQAAKKAKANDADILKAQQARDALEQQIKVSLAVIGLNTPE